jgi:hypothetical protein
LNFDEKSRVIQKAVQKLAEAMAENNRKFPLTGDFRGAETIAFRWIEVFSSPLTVVM